MLKIGWLAVVYKTGYLCLKSAAQCTYTNLSAGPFLQDMLYLDYFNETATK